MHIYYAFHANSKYVSQVKQIVQQNLFLSKVESLQNLTPCHLFSFEKIIRTQMKNEEMKIVNLTGGSVTK